MATDETMGKPSIEDCVKDACREALEMKNGGRAEGAWATLREELKGRVD